MELPEILVVDNCCQVRRQVCEVMPDILVVLDVYHFLMRCETPDVIVVQITHWHNGNRLRYSATIINGTKNPHRSEVLRDIRDAIIRKPAGKNVPATYWGRSEQEGRLVSAFNRWAEHGDVWAVAATKVSHCRYLNSLVWELALNPLRYRSMQTSLAMFKKAALHEGVRTLRLTEAGLRAHIKGGTLFSGHSLVELKSILAWHMTSSCAEIFALPPQMAGERRQCVTNLSIQHLDHITSGW